MLLYKISGDGDCRYQDVDGVILTEFEGIGNTSEPCIAPHLTSSRFSSSIARPLRNPRAVALKRWVMLGFGSPLITPVSQILRIDRTTFRDPGCLYDVLGFPRDLVIPSVHIPGELEDRHPRGGT